MANFVVLNASELNKLNGGSVIPIIRTPGPIIPGPIIRIPGPIIRY